jgi:2-polyprenyl-3-methyl-5-hydroxy-6-metoxy-1,4-benzoquinol methylase
MLIEIIKKNIILYKILKPFYLFALSPLDYIRRLWYEFFPNSGMASYQRMQQRAYENLTGNLDDSKNLCVGSFDAHQKYPYEEYLLEHFEGQYGAALDFACGMGRMMHRMQKHFRVVDGVDLSKNNLKHAVNYLTERGISNEKYSLFLSEGIGVKEINKKYDFIYSTIALQHISAHSIRTKIFKDLNSLLKDGGFCCFQMGFGWDNKIHWFDNNYVARSTNGGCDVTIPNSNHLDSITKDFEAMGFKDIRYEFKISPHPQIGSTYHPIWIFIHMKK